MWMFRIHMKKWQTDGIYKEMKEKPQRDFKSLIDLIPALLKSLFIV